MQKFLDPGRGVETAETAALDASVGNVEVILDRHTIDMDGSAVSRGLKLEGFNTDGSIGEKNSRGVDFRMIVGRPTRIRFALPLGNQLLGRL